MARLISYIHHTSEYKQCCHVGNTAKQCRLGLFQDFDFAGDLEDSKSTSDGTLCNFRKPHVRSNQLAQQNQKSFLWMQVKRMDGAAKARPIVKPSSTSCWDFTPMEQRQWIVIEIQ